ncbi:EAL domain-containing protein [Thalassotalea aquiviva]|uniref:bifunctional diguanylate cyclase/phosphodiesterase n=1 Tax=Thalassotalea aquiviva TaxID=3242415 RepID=UPI00352B74E8
MTPSSVEQRLLTLLSKYKQSKKVQTGLLRLAELTSVATDLDVFCTQLQTIIKRYFPAKNLYLQLFTQPHNIAAAHYYVDELNIAPIDKQLSTDVVEFIRTIGNPIFMDHDQVSILDPEQGLTKRPFPSRDKYPKLIDKWLAAPLVIEGISIGLVAIAGFESKSKSVIADLQIIRFIANQIASAIHRNCANDKLKSYSTDLEDVIFDRTKDLIQTNKVLQQKVEHSRVIEEKLYFAAHHDTLTKLPNRKMITERIEQRLKQANNKFAILFIDLDRFKVINDTLGHHIGDQLLIQISARIAECIRTKDTLARLGGDEFVILLDSLNHPDDAEYIALRIIDSINQPFLIEGQQLHSSASIGINIVKDNYHNALEVLRDADAAMYQAKAMGRNRFVFFDDSMREELLANLTLEQDLRQALNKQEFVLHLQKISAIGNNNATIGYEALLRWQHPSRGLLSPIDFLEMAEETGLIIAIEYWILKQVGQQIKQWQHSAQANAFISINLSGKHLTQSKYIQRLSQKITEYVCRPQQLILEFNESAFSQSTELTLNQLKRIKSTGVKLALDGYGSGISSLNYLQNYPFEIIKLDQSFVRSFNSNEKNLKLAKTLCELGSVFGYHLVAEGIESEKQLLKAIEAGCDYGQGFYISRPQSSESPESDQKQSEDDVDNCA